MGFDYLLMVKIKKTIMFKNNLKIAIRILWKNKWYTMINMLGLSLGISCTILIANWVKYELSYDQFHKKKDRIFVVHQNVQFDDTNYLTDRTGGLWGATLYQGFSEVVDFVRMRRPGELLMKYEVGVDNRKLFMESSAMAVDSSFFKMFSFPVIAGDPNSALTDPHSLVMTREMAVKYFGDNWNGNGSPIGQTIRINDEYDFVVTAIVEDLPKNSSILFDFLVPFAFLYDLGFEPDNYGGTVYYTFLELTRTSDYQEVSSRIPEYIFGFWQSELETDPFLVPLKDVHLYGESRNYFAVYIITGVAFLILIIACINFINLSTAKSIKRAKEIGIRKMSGAVKHQLIGQFLAEALIITVLAMHLALVLTELFMPEFNRLFGLSIIIEYGNVAFISLLLAITLMITLLAGAYPAFVMASYKPALILRSNASSGGSGKTLRRVLVVSQFTFSIIIIISTVVMYKQFNHVKEMDYGFDQDGVVYLSSQGTLSDNYRAFRGELLAHSSIVGVASASEIPKLVQHGEIDWGHVNSDNTVLARVLWADHNFTDFFDIQVVEGKFYQDDTPGNDIVVNEEIVKIMGYDNPIGEKFYLFEVEYQIIGVVKNFSFFPFNLGAKALIMPHSAASDLVFVKIDETSSEEAISYINSTFNRFNEAYPFEYSYLSETSHPAFENSGSVNKIMIYAAGFGIFISCLGLFGLSAFNAEQKTKEVGIRKVFGANIPKVILTLLREYIVLILLATIIATPISYFLLNQVLQFFTNHIEITPWIYIGTLMVVYFITFVTVSWQTITAAVKNPTDCLRYE